jgi:hypothetical protein
VSQTEAEPLALAGAAAGWYVELMTRVRPASALAGRASDGGRRAFDLAEPVREPSLGGQLLYASVLDDAARPLLIAANIAGAASLAAAGDAAAQRQAVRDGVIDFLVNSLDEALRILKNEVRKRNTVAVCIALAPGAVDAEMAQRGVLPDLVRQGEVSDRDPRAEFVSWRAGAESGQVLLAWRVEGASATWLPKLDAVADACLTPSDTAAKRWLRLAPRYLGRLTQGAHTLPCTSDAADGFLAQVRELATSGAIPVAVEVEIVAGGKVRRERLAR